MRICNRRIMKPSGMIVSCEDFKKDEMDTVGICINPLCSHSHFKKKGVPLRALVSKVIITRSASAAIVKSIHKARLYPLTFKINGVWDNGSVSHART